MALSFRHYLFQDDGSLRRVPRRIADELPSGGDAVPEFAGTSQKVLEVLVESEDRRPARILDARGIIWTFDDEGRVDEHLINLTGERMQIAEDVRRARRMKVPDLRPEIRLREFKAKHEWEPTADDLDRIAADIWPGKNGPASEVTSVKGKAPKKPPLTSDGKWALDDIAKSVEMISNRLIGLSERALRGLAFEAHRLGSQEDEALWRGVADEAKRREAIRAAHRTGKGEWIAVLDVSREDPDFPIARRQVVTEHVKCANRKEAIAAGRRLMAEKAEWFAEGTFVEVSLCSALEWQPEE